MNRIQLKHVLPSKQYFPWHQKIKRQLTGLQQRYDDLLKQILRKNRKERNTEDECFIICGKGTCSISKAINNSIEKELVPDDERDELKTQSPTIDETFTCVHNGDVFIIPYDLTDDLLCKKTYSINHQYIIVATDSIEYEEAIASFQGCPNVKVTLLKDLREKASLMLEESMFKPMRSNAERLDKFLKLEQTYRTLNGKKISNMKRMITKYRWTSYKSVKRLQVRKNKKTWSKGGNIPKEGKKTRNMTKFNVCASFINLRKRRNKAKVLAKNINLWKDSIERLYNEIMGMFNRSRIPEQSKPNIGVGFHHKVDDKVSTELYKTDFSVKSCGYRYSTLQVFVDDTSNEKINNSIKKVLQKYGIDDFEIVPSIASYKPFLGVGAKAKPKDDRYGSVGGFAEIRSGMCALISRHVALNSGDGEVVLSDCKTSKSIRSNLIPETVAPVNPSESVLDISATLIQPTDTVMCETKFMSGDGDPMIGIECTYEDKKLDGRPVHLWGASTAPGLGTITMSEIRDREHDKTFIFVENRAGSTDDFCKEGDSGAMVCADNDYESTVEVISMLIGGDTRNPGKYATFRIDKGLEQLKRQTDSHFELLKD